MRSKNKQQKQILKERLKLPVVNSRTEQINEHLSYHLQYDLSHSSI